MVFFILRVFFSCSSFFIKRSLFFSLLLKKKSHLGKLVDVVVRDVDVEAVLVLAEAVELVQEAAED